MYNFNIRLYNKSKIVSRRKIAMRHKLSILFVALLGVFLLVPLAGVANASVSPKKPAVFLGTANQSPKEIFISMKEGIMDFFRGAKGTTKRTAGKVGHEVVRGAREVKSETRKTAGTVGHGVAGGARKVGTETKKAAKTVKKGIVDAWDSLKNR